MGCAIMCFLAVTFLIITIPAVFGEVNDRLRSISDHTVYFIEEAEEDGAYTNSPRIDFARDTFLKKQWITAYKEDGSVYYSALSEKLPLKLSYRKGSKEYFYKRYGKEYYRFYGSLQTIENSHYYIVTGVAMNRQINRLQLIILWLGLLIIGFSSVFAIAGALFSQYMLAPFTMIARTMNSVSDKNLSQRITIERQDEEICALRDAVNRLFERLEKAFIAERRFITEISHEIKTPISILRLTIESLTHDEQLPQATYDKLTTSLDLIYTINFLLKRLLLLARLDEIKNPLNREEINIGESISRICETLRIIAESKGVALHYHEEKAVFVNADRELFYIALFNLIENAVKYTDRGAVNIQLRSKKESWTLTIADTGRGIGAADLAHIFERFYRSPESAAEVKGHGIGLAIAKKILDLHMMSISAVSTQGKGTEFTITGRESSLVIEI